MKCTEQWWKYMTRATFFLATEACKLKHLLWFLFCSEYFRCTRRNKNVHISGCFNVATKSERICFVKILKAKNQWHFPRYLTTQWKWQYGVQKYMSFGSNVSSKMATSYAQFTSQIISVLIWNTDKELKRQDNVKDKMFLLSVTQPLLVCFTIQDFLPFIHPKWPKKPPKTIAFSVLA